jgi:hypothetical protein
MVTARVDHSANGTYQASPGRKRRKTMHIAIVIMIAVMLLAGPLRRFSEQFMHRIKPEEYNPPTNDYKPENQTMLDLIDATANTASNAVEGTSRRGAFYIGLILFLLSLIMPPLALLFIGYCIFMIYAKFQKIGPWRPEPGQSGKPR